ncbi:LysR family transcriptional regulator [Marinobacter bohaiensis]|uniref:LysR family transcriptional regulator n=1 Tax=Marinobacter bohaiensis TaxID=2201898 RepID=UPI0013A6BB4F|nr:LysR family transcriptional regulator [Marinobacter bohaiensis]
MKEEIQPDAFFTKMVSLTALKAFVASARYKSFTDAAKALCLTQSAVSRQVRELEDQLGTPLFKRERRTIELTDSGQRLYETSYVCFSHIAQTVKEITPSPATTSNPKIHLRIAMTHAFSIFWMANKIGDLRSLFPDIDLSIYATDDINLIDHNQNIDCYINLTPSQDNNFVSTALFSEKVYPVCSQEYLERHPYISEVENLHKADLLHLKGSMAHQGFGWRQWFDFTLQGADPAEKIDEGTFTASNYELLIKLVRNHQGVALGWHHLVESLLQEGKLVRPVSQFVELGNAVHYFIHRKNNDKQEAILKIKNWLLSNL